MNAEIRIIFLLALVAGFIIGIVLMYSLNGWGD